MRTELLLLLLLLFSTIKGDILPLEFPGDAVLLFSTIKGDILPLELPGDATLLLLLLEFNMADPEAVLRERLGTGGGGSNLDASESTFFLFFCSIKDDLHGEHISPDSAG